MPSPARRRVLTLTLAAAIGLAACTAPHQPLLLAAVGPAPGARSRGPEGTLQVFSQTTPFNDGGIVFYPHSEYRIYQPDGAFLKFVRNHTLKSDQRPELVNLPVGEYYLVALSEGFGPVRVPFVIKGGQVTVVTLDSARHRSIKGAPNDQVVSLPNGAVVGWRASPEEP